MLLLVLLGFSLNDLGILADLVCLVALTDLLFGLCELDDNVFNLNLVVLVHHQDLGLLSLV